MNTKINDIIFKEFPILTSERLLLRAFQMSDAKDIFNIRSNPQVMEFMDTDHHKSISDSEKLIENIHRSFNKKSGINWAIINQKTNDFIGYFGYWRLDRQNCRAEIGYALKTEYWGKGFMSESFEILIPFGFNNLQIHSIEANVNKNNIDSIKVLEKFKFRKEAHFRENYLFNGEFIDSIIYCLLEID